MPLELDEPTPTLDGLSVGEHFSQIRDRLGPQPVVGTWSSGASTLVTVQLGEPRAICEPAGIRYHLDLPRVPGQVIYQVPLNLQTADGRVQITRNALGRVTRREGVLDGNSILIEEWGERTENFAAHTGISGIDFADLAPYLVTWLVYLGGMPDEPRGLLSVSSDAAQDSPVDQLTW